MSLSLVESSEALHSKVRAFGRGEGQTSFDELALEIAIFQMENNAGYRKLVEHRRSRLECVEAIPAVPTETFRLARVAVHPPDLDVVRFMTSGTSAEARGVHALRTTRTYEELSVQFGRRALMSGQDAVLVGLAQEPLEPIESSLAFMIQEFMNRFERSESAPADRVMPRGRWLFNKGGVDLIGFERARAFALESERPLLVLSTSLALARLLEQRAGEHLTLPPGSVVMHTGGPKRKQGDLDLPQLRAQIAEVFELPTAQIVGEYGMTELSSQLYEGTASGVDLDGPPGVFLAPPWLRVAPVDAVTLEPVAPGQIGLARFVDLANVDSAVCVVTQDLIRVRASGIELLGRQPGAMARGCSLAIDALLGSTV